MTLPVVLNVHGYDVVTAASVPEALSIITSAQRFDVLISDLNMGHIADGFTVIHTMRKVNPQCINLILTGYPAFESALQALREQVDDYMTKPSDIPRMIATIERRLKERGPRPQRPLLRLSSILRNNVAAVRSRSLVSMKATPELAALNLSDDELVNSLERTVLELADYLDSGLPTESSEPLLRSARLRGQLRHSQHYSLRLMVKKQRLIAEVINNLVYENLLSVNLSFLLLDLNKLNDAVLLQLEESIESFLQAGQQKD